MNVKKCFAYVLAMFGISVSFAFFFPVGTYADFEENETTVEEEQEEQEEYLPLLTSESPAEEYVSQEVYQENMNNLFNLLDKKLPTYDVVKDINYTKRASDIVPSEQLVQLQGLNPVFDEMIEWAVFEGVDAYFKNYAFKDYDIFPTGSYRISNYDSDIAFLLLISQEGEFKVIPLYEYEYYDVVTPFESYFQIIAFEDYDFVIQSLNTSVSVGGEAFDNMSNKLDRVITDIYSLKESIAVIGFILLFSVMYPLLTSVTHKFMGRKD